MKSESTTIRVARATRDLLAEQARERGLSLAAMLGEMAEEHRRQAIWSSERQASRIDAEDPEASAETREWDATLEDGLA